MKQIDLFRRDWCERMTPIVVERMAGKTFTTDDVHPIVDPPEHDNWYGIMLSRMKKIGLVRKVGYRPSTRPEANYRNVFVWEVV